MDVIRNVKKSSGVVLRDDLVAAGVSANTIATWRKRNRLTEVLPNVYREPGDKLSWRGMCEAAAHWAGPEGALSHFTAAVLHDLPQFVAEAPIHLLVPAGVRVPQKPEFGLELHYGSQEDKREFSTFGALRVTSLSRTLMDLGDVMSEQGFALVLGDAIQRRRISRERLEEVRARRKGRRGARKFTSFIDLRRDELQPVDSELERKFLNTFVRCGLETVPRTRFVIQKWEMRYRADFAFPEQKLIIEIDGYENHSARVDWAKDIAKNNHVVTWGWSVLRFTHESLEDPEATVQMIREALLERGWDPKRDAHRAR